MPSLIGRIRASIVVDRDAGRITIDLFGVDRAIYDAAIDYGPQRYHEPKDGRPEFWSKTVDDRRHQIRLHLHTDKPPKEA